MATNKKWMELIDDDRVDDAYKNGVENYLNYAFTRLGQPQLICCPCMRCGNATSRTCKEVKSHLIVHGMIQLS